MRTHRQKKKKTVDIRTHIDAYVTIYLGVSNIHPGRCMYMYNVSDWNYKLNVRQQCTMYNYMYK